VRILGNFARNYDEKVRNIFGEDLEHAGGSVGEISHNFSSSVGVPRTVPAKVAVAKYEAMIKFGQNMLGTTREPLEFLVARDGERPRSLTAQDIVDAVTQGRVRGAPDWKARLREWGRAGIINQPREAKQRGSINQPREAKQRGPQPATGGEGIRRPQLAVGGEAKGCPHS
jgi:hypothetical protein